MRRLLWIVDLWAETTLEICELAATLASGWTMARSIPNLYPSGERIPFEEEANGMTGDDFGLPPLGRIGAEDETP